MPPATVGSLDEIRAQIEQVAFDPELSDAARSAILTDLRGRLTELAGRIDQYLRESDKLRQGEASVQEAALNEVRRNADLREELLRRALAAPEELDSWGFVSHEELDRLAEEGLLEEAAEKLAARAAEMEGFTPAEARDNGPGDGDS